MRNILRDAKIVEMLGFIFEDVRASQEEMLFKSSGGGSFKFYHRQDCCEGVYIEDIVGDVKDLIGSPILTAEERIQTGEVDCGHTTWTFYEFATIKGSVTVRWYGSSNGYYSESVYLQRLLSPAECTAEFILTGES